MHFPDLTLCQYHSGPHDADEWHSPLLAIGWLEHPHPFPTGPAMPELAAKLEALMACSWKHYPAYAFRGLHTCTLCSIGELKLQSSLRSQEVRSHENLWIPGDRVIYLTPGMITHYVGDHRYAPPEDFIKAVMECPDYGSEACCLALLKANGDHAVPLRTVAEFDAKRAAFLQELARHRAAQS